MNALVTGGAGFIGSHLVDALLEGGHHVVVIDDLSTGSLDNLPLVANQHGDERLRICDKNVEDQGRIFGLSELFEDVDVVFHFAADASIENSMHDPVGSVVRGIRETTAVLLNAVKAHVKRVVFASSCAVYGDSTAQDCGAEETKKPEPLSAYGTMKFAGETICKQFALGSDVDTVSLRFFNVYGPRQRTTAVIPRFITSLLKHKTVTIIGDGTQARDFIYVADVVQTCLDAASYSTGRLSGAAYNVGTGRGRTINYVVEAIANTIGSRTPYISRGDEHSKRAPYDIGYIRANMEVTNVMFGPHNHVLFDVGLQRTVDYFVSKLDGEKK